MSLPPTFLDDIRNRVGLSALIGKRVKLQRAGREFKGCCPFHNEKTPSFYVNDEKNFYHCFGCGAHGDAIGFVMEQDGLTFIEAVKYLATEAGLEMPVMERTPQEKRRASLGDLLETAANWFEEQLQTIAGADARDYLRRRDVPAQLCQHFQLGFSLASNDALASHLHALFPDARPDDLVAAGLQGESDGRRYDRFRGRLMFPIHSPRGKVVGFGARTLADDQQPKYLNSAEGPVFDKGRLLYNYHRAAPAARKSGRLLVVEGYMDVVGLARAGLTQVVAPLGTALTPEQLQLAWRLVDVPAIAFDGDAAGMRAGRQAAMRALPLLAPGKSLSFIALPPGQDPDDIARSGGLAAIEALIDRAQPLERFLFSLELEEYQPLDTPERRAALLARLDELAAEIADNNISRDYRQTWRNRFYELRSRQPAVRQAPKSGRARGNRSFTPPPLRPETRAAAGRSTEELVMEGIIASIARRPGAAIRHQEMLLSLDMPSAQLEEARNRLFDDQVDETVPDALPTTIGPELPDDLTDHEFDRRIQHALASLAELHHIEEELQPRDCSSEEAFAEEYARRSMLGAARAEARQRLADWAVDEAGKTDKGAP